MFRGMRIKSCWHNNGYIVHHNMAFSQSIHHHIVPYIGIKLTSNFFCKSCYKLQDKSLSLDSLSLCSSQTLAHSNANFSNVCCLLINVWTRSIAWFLLSVWTFKCVKIARCKEKQKPLCANLSIVCENYKIRKVTWNNNKKW
jgi:hypothetical protein